MMREVRQKIQHASNQKGFTLIELIVAMLITAIIGAMSFASVSTARRAIESMEERAERLSDLNSLFFRLTKDIEAIIPRGAQINGQTEQALEYSSFDGDGLSFTNAGWVNPLPEVYPRSNLQRVNYSLEDGKIKRKRWSVVDRSSDVKVQEQELIDQVDSVSLRFIAPTSVSQISGRAPSLRWIEKWPDATQVQNYMAQNTGTIATDILPMAMEIKIELEPWGEIVRVFEVGYD